MHKLSGFRHTTSRMVGHVICVTHKIFTAPQSYIMSDTFSGCEQAIGTTAWNNIHGLSYHTYQTSLSGIQNDLNSLYSTYGKPIWVTEIADGSGSSMAANQQLMVQFVAWAASRTWIERVFWNQAVRSSTSIHHLCCQLSQLQTACTRCLLTNRLHVGAHTVKCM